MVDRDERRAEAAKHIALMKGAFAAETAASIEAAVVYEDGDGRELELPDPAFGKTTTSVTTAFPATALYDAEGKAAVIDPASFSRPAGNYEEGAFGPEQALCADSNLYQVLQGMRDRYYRGNRGYASGQLFTDRAMYLPDVVFNRGGDIRTANVIAIPEPNRARALENHRSERECDECLENRIETLLRIAAVNECQTVVTGAFGCGRQGFDVDQVIGLFKKWIEAHPGAIGHITFAVPRAHVSAFEAAFGEPKASAPTPASHPHREHDDDDFDLSSITLPEGVTLR